MYQQNDRVKVAVRLRPLNQLELSSPNPFPAWRASSSNSTIAQLPSTTSTSSSTKPSVSHEYKYDLVFDETSKNSDVYTSLCTPIISSAIAGYNTTLLAYGQTCSGKTHSMLGNSKDPGLTSLAIRQVFRQLPDTEKLVSISYIEIYNDNLRDLLDVSSSKKKLIIRDNNQTTVSIVGATEVCVNNAKDALRLLKAGQLTRKTSDTSMNQRSSRSHTLFILRFQKGNALYLVDLAGSERAKGTNASGIRLKEGSFINQSLLTLSTIINRLSNKEEKNKNGHIPYRNSKLTRLLRPSLGGDSNTAILCTITPAMLFSDETLSTLKFATRASGIVNDPKIKKLRAPSVDYQSKYRQAEEEVSTLRSKCDQLQQEITLLRNNRVSETIMISGNSSSITASSDTMSSWSSEYEDEIHDEHEPKTLRQEGEGEEEKEGETKGGSNLMSEEEVSELKNQLVDVEKENKKLRERLLKMTVNFTMMRMRTAGLNESVQKRTRPSTHEHDGVHVRDNALKYHPPSAAPSSPSSSSSSSSSLDIDSDELIDMTSTDKLMNSSALPLENETQPTIPPSPLTPHQIRSPHAPKFISCPSNSSRSASLSNSSIEITNDSIIQRITFDSSCATSTMDPSIGGGTALALALNNKFNASAHNTRNVQQPLHHNNKSPPSTSSTNYSAQNRSVISVVDNVSSMIRNLFSPTKS